MIKKLFILLLFAGSINSYAQKNARIDTTAIFILQQTSTTLQSFNSCSFKATVNYDVWSNELGLVKHSNDDNVYLQFPDKFKIISKGDKGDKALLYNGSKMYYYSFINNNYAEVPAMPSIIQTIDTINKMYGVDFPAGDFFYPDFVQDVVNTGANLVYLGITEINGQSCFHIAGKDANATFQFWITNDDWFLPLKMLIVYATEQGSPQYEEVYSDWKINNNFPDAMFEFAVPPKASKIQLVPTAQK